jgi:trk system potassium uptake protein TrkH
MLRRIQDLPLLVILMGIAALTMYLPAVQAFATRQHMVARAFFYSGTILMILTVMIAIATVNRRTRNPARTNLTALVAAYIVLPVLFALPFSESVRDTSFLNAWFEMLSAFTTTGATLYDDPTRLPETVHLWRALVGWLGGFFILVAAMAILAPMNLGGVEVISGRVPGRGEGLSQITRIADPAQRVVRHAIVLFPAYGGLTLTLWVLLLMSGDTSLVALCHAMGAISTSGISPVGGLQGSASGILGEVLVFLVLLTALSRRTMPGTTLMDRNTRLWKDSEIRMALVILATVPCILVLRHWIGATEAGEEQNFAAAIAAFWGALFTTLSFLTTTGYASADWATARVWSGLGTPGLVLAGLAIVGGGVATTAGGVKLLRVYALFRHGERELERLIHPSSIGGAGQSARRLRREGAYVAWIFFMLFAMSIAVICAALSLVRIEFEAALVLTIAALTTTGQLAVLATEQPILYADLGGAAKAILGFAMVIGRLETLAILALLAPDSWRR